MDIYFAGAIRGGRDDADLYGEIIDLLQGYGSVLTEHVAGGETAETDAAIFERDMAWLRAADAVVAEVTVPSLGVGYELARAEERGVPTLCLFRPGAGQALSAMVQGNDALRVVEYGDVAELAPVFDGFLGEG